MLETFNGLKVEYKKNDEFLYKNIPIKYSTREKLNLFDEVEEKHILSGNYNVLPRTTIALTTIVKNNERQTNKFNKIATTEFGEFIFNAVSYDFSYDMTIMCRGMNEASMIIEQITSRFNPTYTLLINEVPNQINPTSVPLTLLDISIESQEYDELSTDIISINVGFILKGNFYSPVEQMEKIKNVDMYLNLWHVSLKNEYSRAKLYQYDVIDSELQSEPTETQLVSDDGTFGNIPPIIEDLISDNSGEVSVPINIKAIVKDYDNKPDELSYIWDVQGDANISVNEEGIDDSEVILIGNSTEMVEVRCMVTDYHGNTSNMFIKQITIV